MASSFFFSITHTKVIKMAQLNESDSATWNGHYNYTNVS